ncbi:hypothetical protein IAG25_32690 [Caballeronia sp. EK]|uniref:hypothetical protein n=1 Tax=Caballeronia sp. EK TaxID=2767469 RepID=UPI0016553EF6|nr:hypothetical protein [Caballeronia sp. EK]MBC8641583.1 hypothetical protein [Caballeronia sp. EK]
MTGKRLNLRPGLVAGFVVWAIACSALAAMPVPHTMFICEHIESFFQSSPDDELIKRAKTQLAGVLWISGLGVASLSMAAVRGIRRARGSRPAR